MKIYREFLKDILADLFSACLLLVAVAYSALHWPVN